MTDKIETKRCWICQRELAPGESCICDRCEAEYTAARGVHVTQAERQEAEELDAADWREMTADLRHGG